MAETLSAPSASQLPLFMPILSTGKTRVARVAYTACSVSGLGRSTIYEWIAKRKIKTIKVGTRVLVETDSLLRHLASLQTP